MSNIDFSQYELASKETTALTEGLMKIWEKLGRPDDCSNNYGWAMLDAIVALWAKFYPQEHADWMHDRKEDLKSERSMAEHIKGGVYNPITYPPTLYQLIKALLPKQKLTDKVFHHKLVIRYPLFKSTNFKI